jgi:hypothetical protein
MTQQIITDRLVEALKTTASAVDPEAGPRVLRPSLRVAGIGPEPGPPKTPGGGSNHSSPPTSTDDIRL